MQTPRPRRQKSRRNMKNGSSRSIKRNNPAFRPEGHGQVVSAVMDWNAGEGMEDETSEPHGRDNRRMSLVVLPGASANGHTMVRPPERSPYQPYPAMSSDNVMSTGNPMLTMARPPEQKSPVRPSGSRPPARRPTLVVSAPGLGKQTQS